MYNSTYILTNFIDLMLFLSYKYHVLMTMQWVINIYVDFINDKLIIIPQIYVDYR
jgi:hypothetical protein